MEVNDRYQKVVDTILNLATASLVLPILFLRSFLGVPDDKPILSKLSCLVFVAWTLLFFAIAFGILFYYASAKWVKLSLGQPVWLSPTALERVLDWAFWLMVICFLSGLVSFIVYAVHVA